jgi:hypothetical protein
MATAAVFEYKIFSAVTTYVVVNQLEVGLPEITPVAGSKEIPGGSGGETEKTVVESPPSRIGLIAKEEFRATVTTEGL